MHPFIRSLYTTISARGNITPFKVTYILPYQTASCQPHPSYIIIFLHTGNQSKNPVGPSCATTSGKRPLFLNTKIFSVQSLQLEPLVSDLSHFLGREFDEISCKQPLDPWFNLTTKNFRTLFVLIFSSYSCQIKVYFGDPQEY